MNLATGTQVRWESAAGVMRGTIKNIVLAPAADNKVTPWIDIEVRKYYKLSGTYLNNTVRLCASDSNLKMMRVALVV